MKNEIIQNQYDGPQAPKKKLSSEKISLDYIYSGNAVEIDLGIKETIKGLGLSILAIGMGLAKLKALGLYVDLNFRSMNDYLTSLCNEMKVERSTVHNWLYIGESYTKYRRDLERIEFTDADGPTKLPYVARALEIYEKREVFKNVKDLSLQAFKEWSKGEPMRAKKYKSVRIQGSSIFVGNSPLVSFAEGISPKDRRYYEALLLEGAKAIKQNEYAKIYRFYDVAEARLFDRYYQRELKNIRTKK